MVIRPFAACACGGAHSGAPSKISDSFSLKVVRPNSALRSTNASRAWAPWADGAGAVAVPWAGTAASGPPPVATASDEPVAGGCAGAGSGVAEPPERPACTSITSAA